MSSLVVILYYDFLFGESIYALLLSDFRHLQVMKMYEIDSSHKYIHSYEFIIQEHLRSSRESYYVDVTRATFVNVMLKHFRNREI